MAPSGSAVTTTDEAWWANWWGSPQLFARIATRMQQSLAVGGREPPVVITFSNERQEESFESPGEFLIHVSPEMLRTFTSAECRVEGSVSISLTCRRRRFPWQRKVEEGLRLQVVREGESHSPLEPDIMRKLVREVGRGYRPYWGPSEWPSALVTRGAWVEHARVLRQALLLLLGIALGAALGLVVLRLFDDRPPAWGPLLIVLAGLLPPAVDFAIPNIEIAALGHTRAVVLARRLAGSSAAAIGPPLAALLFG